MPNAHEIQDLIIMITGWLGMDHLLNHANEDEAFFILEGELLFEEEGKDPFTLQKGDFYVVGKGVNHRVSSDAECQIMLIENKTTAHTGVVESTVTKSIEEQLK